MIKTENCQVNRLWAEWVFEGTSYPAHVTLFETAVAAPPPHVSDGLNGFEPWVMRNAVSGPYVRYLEPNPVQPGAGRDI